MDHKGEDARNHVEGEARDVSDGARRMRITRERRREGMRCFTLEIRNAEIDRLVDLGYLRAADRDDRNQVVQGFYRFFDSALGGAHRGPMEPAE